MVLGLGPQVGILSNRNVRIRQAENCLRVSYAPSTFQRLMERSMGLMNLKEVLVFIDDLIVFSSSLEEHEQHLQKVLLRLKEYGLKLAPEKCKFFQSSVKYLGHVVSEHGVETDSEKIKALTTWPVPTNLKELRSFLGLPAVHSGIL